MLTAAFAVRVRCRTTHYATPTTIARARPLFNLHNHLAPPAFMGISHERANRRVQEKRVWELWDLPEMSGIVRPCSNGLMLCIMENGI